MRVAAIITRVLTIHLPSQTISASVRMPLAARALDRPGPPPAGAPAGDARASPCCIRRTRRRTSLLLSSPLSPSLFFAHSLRPASLDARSAFVREQARGECACGRTSRHGWRREQSARREPRGRDGAAQGSRHQGGQQRRRVGPPGRPAMHRRTRAANRAVCESRERRDVRSRRGMRKAPGKESAGDAATSGRGSDRRAFAAPERRSWRLRSRWACIPAFENAHLSSHCRAVATMAYGRKSGDGEVGALRP